MLLSRDAIVDAVEICEADDFYKPAHGHVFDAVCSLYGQGEPVDPVTVADELRRADLLDAAGGPASLVSLQANTPATSNAARDGDIAARQILQFPEIGALQAQRLLILYAQQAPTPELAATLRALSLAPDHEDDDF